MRASISEIVYHLITYGPEDEAWQTYQFTAETLSEGARSVQILKEIQQKRRLGGGRHLCCWGLVDRWHTNGNLVGCDFVFRDVFIRVLPQVTNSDGISYFEVVTTHDLCSVPIQNLLFECRIESRINKTDLATMCR